MKTEFKTHKIVGRIKVRGKMTNVYKTDQDALYYITEPGRNRKYITGAKKRKVKKHKKRPYFLEYDQQKKKYPRRKR